MLPPVQLRCGLKSSIALTLLPYGAFKLEKSEGDRPSRVVSSSDAVVPSSLTLRFTRSAWRSPAVDGAGHWGLGAHGTEFQHGALGNIDLFVGIRSETRSKARHGGLAVSFAERSNGLNGQRSIGPG
ncbi:MAG: hypothetical protein M1815_005244 [Lichina confinis]|nr:MAG: hypothetical protein M1815_005244 [Lichina confinis]